MNEGHHGITQGKMICMRTDNDYILTNHRLYHDDEARRKTLCCRLILAIYISYFIAAIMSDSGRDVLTFGKSNISAEFCCDESSSTIIYYRNSENLSAFSSEQSTIFVGIITESDSTPSASIYFATSS